MSLGGGYVWFVDADDMIEKNCIAKLVQEAEENNLDMLFFNHKMVEPMFDKVPSVSGVYNIKMEWITEPVEETIYKRFHRKTTGYVWRYIVSKKVVEKNHLYFVPNVTMCEDVDFNFYLYKVVQKVGYMDNTFYYYRWSPDSVTKSFNNDDGKKRYIASRLNQASDHQKRLNEYDENTREQLKEKILYDVQGSINMGIGLGDVLFQRALLTELKKRNLYPYPYPYKNIIPHGNIKKYLIDVISILYPYETVPIVLTWIVGLKKKMKRYRKGR